MKSEAQPSASDDRLMMPREVAQLLGISRQTLNDWIRTKRIPSVCISRNTRRFVRSQVEAWLKDSARPAQAERSQQE
jgi:excisionase family DNA binding protein